MTNIISKNRKFQAQKTAKISRSKTGKKLNSIEKKGKFGKKNAPFLRVFWWTRLGFENRSKKCLGTCWCDIYFSRKSADLGSSFVSGVRVAAAWEMAPSDWLPKSTQPHISI